MKKMTKVTLLSHVETIFVFFISYVLFTSSVFAQSSNGVPNVQDMITNIARDLPSLMYFVTAFAYVFGFWFVFHGLLLLKKFGMQRTQMSGDANLGGPLLSIFVGAALIYLPSTIKAGMTTFWTDPNPYHYDTKDYEEWNTFFSACFMIIQLVGVIAFIRGMMLMTKLGQGGQQATFGKVAAYIIGGVFCIDMRDFLQAVFTTLGLGSVPGLT